jgi:hypothetical protein
MNLFETLLGRFFPAFRIFGQKLVFQSAIWSLGETSGVKFHQECDGAVSAFPELHHDPVYLIAACAADESCLPSHEPGLSLFDDAAESVYEHYNEEISRHIAAGKLLAEQEKELADLRSRLNDRSSGPGWWSRWFGKS